MPCGRPQRVAAAEIDPVPRRRRRTPLPRASLRGLCRGLPRRKQAGASAGWSMDRDRRPSSMRSSRSIATRGDPVVRPYVTRTHRPERTSSGRAFSSPPVSCAKSIEIRSWDSESSPNEQPQEGLSHYSRPGRVTTTSTYTITCVAHVRFAALGRRADIRPGTKGTTWPEPT